MQRSFYSNTPTLVLLVNLILLVSLSNCKETTYNYTIGEADMVKILVDIHISEAAAEQVDITVRDSFKKIFYEQVFEIQQISKEVFEKEMTYLKKDPDRLSSIYDKVIEKIQAEKKEL